jgi:glycosyltransferase involved in cell wall biosynthesis
VYRSERDPTQLFAAIATMKSKGLISANTFQLVLRASGDEIGYRRDLESLRIQDIVHLKPAIDYVSALEEMLRVDGLVILQASNCNCQVPAKLYEYLRAGRPIIALTDPAGDTARTLDSAGVGVIGRLDSAADIERALLQMFEQIRTGMWPVMDRGAIARYSREAQADQLRRLLDDI